ncbi:DUF106 domain-containing protein [Candidatus Micrarchaeota archaeon]|nr:DUF106 domain-containing protein [Candidatus Micrarchaeota archaeon]MBU1165963.1 DUF106 domain-containing protein [Candidatus Micrarchaeota archaeon]MBU1886867.1 DUF106 domain-containing protein [Candidatus Micrarchaeota archaeon]
MISEIFTALVGVMAIIYAGIARFAQYKLVNRKEMRSIQEESKKISDDMKKAQESGNKTRIDEAMKKQMEFLPKMNTMMMGQFKPMIVILIVFFAFIWVIEQINPYIIDDTIVPMLDDGNGCDAIVGDGIYSACYTPNNVNKTNYGPWSATVKAYEGTNELGHNSTLFFYNSDEDPNAVADGPKGQPITVTTDKRTYYKGETMQIYAQVENGDRIEAAIDNGTSFYVDLPVQIPIINVKRIVQPYWWFILVSLIANLSLSVVISQLEKRGKI